MEKNHIGYGLTAAALGGLAFVAADRAGHLNPNYGAYNDAHRAQALPGSAGIVKLAPGDKLSFDGKNVYKNITSNNIQNDHTAKANEVVSTPSPSPVPALSQEETTLRSQRLAAPQPSDHDF